MTESQLTGATEPDKLLFRLKSIDIKSFKLGPILLHPVTIQTNDPSISAHEKAARTKITITCFCGYLSDHLDIQHRIYGQENKIK